MLESYLNKGIIEAGCDEAGRGCLAGPVFAAAVILPQDYKNNNINDSKKLSLKQRLELRDIIIKDAVSFAIGIVDNIEIDKINILNASFLAMHRAIDNLKIVPKALIIDGNRFNPYKNIQHTCVIKGDGKYLSIAAASILAKTYRDEYMCKIHDEFPEYGWDKNAGYPTKYHRDKIVKCGESPYHRLSFKLIEKQLSFNF